MIAYNREWLDNAALQEEAEYAHKEGCISAEEKARIAAAYPSGFYTPNPFIRSGLFLLTAVIVLFSLAFCCLIFMAGIEKAWRVLVFMFGLGVYTVLEIFIKDKQHHRSGVDDGLLWMSAILLLGVFNIDVDIPAWMHCGMIFLAAGYATLRFADMMMSACAVLAFLGVLFYLYLETGSIARVTVPFVVMIASLLIYQLARRWCRNEKWRHYTNCFAAAEISSLITLYLAGNYFVVREVSNEMFGLHLLPGQSIPAGWLFWTTTILIPIIYLVLGIRQKNISLLRIGLLLAAASIYTIRYYYSILSIEAAMTLCGGLLIAVAYTLIRYLHTPKHGFTYQPVNHAQLFERLQAESLIITETFSTPQAPARNTDFKFGGGTGGGGGAEGAW
ncbi:hypothetical protein [uncultured Chitinophaga sp.]|jgi:hypothetical protein|uniref:hypothetical protein n=1 Tax=uncultured Chitinophaga sp. TaxID=339340 RepID=UPI002601EB4F|nr:hypothetical protein [uncultured Chitinophaga sp.]